MVFDFMKKDIERETKDVGFNEDAIANLCHLIHVEWHSLKSFFETNNEDYLKINNEARKDRSELMDLMIKNSDAENWCISKHTLAVVLSFMELSNRKYSEGKIEESKNYLDKSKKWLGTFMVLNKL